MKQTVRKLEACPISSQVFNPVWHWSILVVLKYFRKRFQKHCQVCHLVKFVVWKQFRLLARLVVNRGFHMAIGVVQMHEEVTVRVLKLIVSGNHKHQQGPVTVSPLTSDMLHCMMLNMLRRITRLCCSEGDLNRQQPRRCKQHCAAWFLLLAFSSFHSVLTVSALQSYNAGICMCA